MRLCVHTAVGHVSLVGFVSESHPDLMPLPLSRCVYVGRVLSWCCLQAFMAMVARMQGMWGRGGQGGAQGTCVCVRGGGHSKQEGWWEELAGEPRLCPTGEKWTRRPSPTISCLNPCRSPCDPCSRSFQGLPKHMPFFGTSWNILSFLFHLLEATQEGGENLRLGSGRLSFKT